MNISSIAIFVLLANIFMTTSANSSTKQLKNTATRPRNTISKTMAISADATEKEANNILDVTGLVVGHAVVADCEYNGVSAGTFSNANAAAMAFFYPKYVSEHLFRKYSIGPVTYDGNKYNFVVSAYGSPPSATNADASLTPVVSGKGARIISDNRLINGSITIASVGRSTVYTFDHATLKLTGGSRTPPNATVTIDGKAYCKDGTAPLPPGLIAPTQVLRGTYAAEHDDNQVILLEFLSSTELEVSAQNGKEHANYDFNGTILRINNQTHGDFFMKIDGDGCFDGPDDLKFCKSTFQKLSSIKAMKKKQAQKKAAAIAAQKRKDAMKLVPNF